MRLNRLPLRVLERPTCLFELPPKLGGAMLGFQISAWHSLQDECYPVAPSFTNGCPINL